MRLSRLLLVLAVRCHSSPVSSSPASRRARCAGERHLPARPERRSERPARCSAELGRAAQRPGEFVQRLRPRDRGGRSGSFARRRRRRPFTTPAFREAQYYVSTRDANGDELAQSTSSPSISSRRACPRRSGLSSISLNGAVQLAWRSNAVDASHGTFDYYRVYSTDYDGSRGVCTANWVVEGSTVSDAFFVGQSHERRVALLCGDGDQPRRTRERLERVASRHAARRRAQRVRLRDRRLDATARAFSFSTTPRKSWAS